MRDGRTVGQTDGWTVGRTCGRRYRRTDGWKDELRGGRTYVRTGVRTQEQTDAPSYTLRYKGAFEKCIIKGEVKRGE